LNVGYVATISAIAATAPDQQQSIDQRFNWCLMTGG